MTGVPVLAGMRSEADWWNILSDWDTYTPQLLATVTNPDLGAGGVAEGSWWRMGCRIRGFARFEFSGAGVDPGDGFYRITLPFPHDPAFSITNTAAGSGRIRNDDLQSESVVVSTGMFTEAGFSVVRMFRKGSNSSVSASSPFLFEDGDAISVNFDYFADPASLPVAPVNQTRWQDNRLLPAIPSRALDQVRFYTPQLTASGEDPDLGAGGTAKGWYRLSNGFVEGALLIAFASEGTVSGGTGTFMFVSVPIARDFSLVTGAGTLDRAHRVGDGSYDFESVNIADHLVAQFCSGCEDRLILGTSGTNTSFNSGTPGTWSNGDAFTVRFFYPADPDALTQLLGVG